MNINRAVERLKAYKHRGLEDWNRQFPNIHVCARLPDGRFLNLTPFEAVAIAREYIRRDRLRTRARARRKKALRTAHESP